MSTTHRVGTGPYRGRDNRAIQRAVDDAAQETGAVVEIPAGTYDMANALHLRSGVQIEGEPGTVLRKIPSVQSPLAHVAGYGHYEFIPAETEKFEVGMGVHVCDDRSGGFYDTVATIVGRSGSAFFLDRMFNHDCHPTQGGRVETLYPIIEGFGVQDVMLRNLSLDGNEQETRTLNGCRGGGVFLLQAHRVTIDSVEVFNYHGDGISFQQCTDIEVRGCGVHHNTGQGLHPGSGSVRYVFEGNQVHDNGGCGVFYCLRTTHSRCEGNRIERNGQVGISIGERDTDHLIRRNHIAHNTQGGIAFRPPVVQSGDRVWIDRNTFDRNNVEGKGAGEIVVPDRLHEIRITGNEFQDVQSGALSVGDGCADISFAANRVNGRPQEPEDITGHTAVVQRELDPGLEPKDPTAQVPADAARHLGIKALVALG